MRCSPGVLPECAGNSKRAEKPRPSTLIQHVPLERVLQQLAQSGQEALVLLVRTDRDAQSALAPQSRTRPDQHAALYQAVDHVGLRQRILGQASPDEVRVRFGDPQAQGTYSVLYLQP